MTNYRALKRLKKVSFYVGLVFILVVLLFPLYWAFQSSITSTRLILSKNPPLFPVSFDFSAYKEVMTRKPIFLWLKNTVFVSITSTVFGVALSLLAGYSLSRFKTMGNKMMGFFLLLSRMLPATLLVIPIYMMFSKVKMINSLWALIMMNLVNIIPFSTWMMKGYFDSIPRELEEAASIDGCTWFGGYTKVVIPLTLPGIAAVSIYSMILCWNEFLYSRTLAYNEKRWVFTVGISSFIGEHSINWSQIMAGGILFIIPLMIAFAFLEPFLVRGLAAGSVKG
jgi:multiple sugar transport system permease protein